MTLQDVLALAKQGNVQAIDLLLNQMLKSKGVTAKTVLKDQRLHLLLESARPLNQASLVPAIHRMISKLDTREIKYLTVYGRQTGQQGQSWSQVIDLQEPDQFLALPEEQTASVPATANPDKAEALVEEATINQVTSDQKLPVFTPPPPPPPERRNNFPPAPPKTDHAGRSASKNRRADQVKKPVKQEESIVARPPQQPDPLVVPNLSTSSLESSSPNHLNGDRVKASTEELELSSPNNGLDDDRGVETTEGVAPTIVPVPQSSGELSLLRSVAVVGMTILLGGIVWFQGSMIIQQESAAVQEASNIVASVGAPEQAESLAMLKADEKKLKAAINQLKAVPSLPLPLLARTQAQVLTPTLETKLQSLQQRIDREEEAAQRLEKAQQLAKQAVATAKSSPSASSLKQAEAEWQQAISELILIPDQTFVSEKAQATLINYQANLAEIRKQMEVAQKSTSQQQRK